jgi:hypothetical protein
MKEYDFALIATCKNDVDAEVICQISNDLFEAGADDCTVSSRGNALIIEFDRESKSYKEAVISAIKQVQAIDSIIVKSVDAGQYVGLSDAAELSELTRSALSKFSKGERGNGNFPTPYLRVASKTPLYDWSEIASWLCSKGLIESELVENAKFTSAINTALKLRNGELEEVSTLVSELACA